MAKLSDKLSNLFGVGTVKSRDLTRLELTTLQDILFDFPFRYDDLSRAVKISAVLPGQKITIQGTIRSMTTRRSQRSARLQVTEGIVEDDSGAIKVIWFHQGFLTKILKPGLVVSLGGKADDQYGLSLVNPVYEVLGKARIARQTGRIMPIYRLTGGLTQKFRRSLVEQALVAGNKMPDWLPARIIKEQKLTSLHHAVAALHFPANEEDRLDASKRIKFDEFFLHQLLHAKTRRELKSQLAPAVPFNEEAVKKAVSKLPFILTGAQKKAIWNIIKDMNRPEPMNRLLEGDVGSGKTVVAALVAFNAAQDGWQTSILAPTEILAEQHAQSLGKLYGDKITVALYTRTKRRLGSKEVSKAQLLAALRNGQAEVAVGTHALLTGDVLFDRLGLIVVDEQHRFGVRQRQALKDKKGSADGIPHLLSMTATPIPRSLALVLYGDLDRSILDEYPAGRKRIVTSVVEPGEANEVYDHMKREIALGRQIFVVCPLIEESDALGANSVNEVYNEFVSGPFSGYRVKMLHGRMKTAEKDEVMRSFANGEAEILISTTVVEVGVDVPNATIMYVEGAERFGLAQLHQLRGRVGRGTDQSYCYLHATDKLSGLAAERLRALQNSENGFELAELDLKLRGPGNIFGTEQSGFERFKMGTMQDIDLMAAAKDYAKEVLDESPNLDLFPTVKNRLADYLLEVHFE